MLGFLKRNKPTKELSPQQQLVRGPVDIPFLMLVLLLTGIGLIMVFSASYASAYYSDSVTGGDPMYYIQRQAIYAVAGLVVMVLVSKLDYRTWRPLAYGLLAASFVLLILVKVPGIGVSAGGANRWIKLGPLPQFQPSELTKLAIILFFSMKMADRGKRKKRPYDLHTLKGRNLSFLERLGLIELIPYVLILGATAILLLLQPHMSATILIIAVAASILFAGGIHYGWFIAGGALVVSALAYIINATEYMASRIAIWQNPWSDPLDKGFQTIQSLYAIGSGGLLGLGLGNSRQKFLYIPAPENDYIFAIVCEELGYVGAVLILCLFALLIMRGYWLALHARDRFGTLVIVGITTQVAVQTFLNIGVVTNLFPVTGISLPFFSYGGTALMMQLVEMGIVLSISRQIPAHREG